MLSPVDTMQQIKEYAVKASKKNGFFGYLQKDIVRFLDALPCDVLLTDGDEEAKLETEAKLEACNLDNTVLLARYAAGDINMRPKRRRGHETNADLVKKLRCNVPARVVLETVVLACRLEAARDECDLREYSASDREHWSNDYAEEDAADKWACRSTAIDEIIAEWGDTASFAVDKNWEEVGAGLESLCELDCD